MRCHSGGSRKVTLHMKSAASLEPVQRKRNHRYEERQSVDYGDISMISQNTEKVSVEPLRSMTSYVRICRDE